MADSAHRAAKPAAFDCSVLPVTLLSTDDRSELFHLISSHFDRVDQVQFFRDLDDKQRIILLRDLAGAIRGFSTMRLIEANLAHERIAAVYAGDTVIDPECWGHATWLYAWARNGFSLARGSGAERAQLLLLTSTHRSYRFLPGFFHEYFPRQGRPTPPEVQARMETLVRSMFPDEYEALRGVVSLRHPTPVRPDRRDPAATTANDEHASFFRARNPGYENGDYLVCIADFTWENLTPLGRRAVRTSCAIQPEKYVRNTSGSSEE